MFILLLRWLRLTLRSPHGLWRMAKALTRWASGDDPLRYLSGQQLNEPGVYLALLKHRQEQRHWRLWWLMVATLVAVLFTPSLLSAPVASQLGLAVLVVSGAGYVGRVREEPKVEAADQVDA